MSALSLSAQAGTYTANGVNLVSLSFYGADLTTTQDANLFGTMYASFGDADNDGVNDLVEAILAVSPTVSDAYGSATISNLHFYSNGEMTYWGTLAFANYLNSISYAGGNQWQLTYRGSLLDQILYTSNVTNVQNNNAWDYYWTGQHVEPNLVSTLNGDMYVTTPYNGDYTVDWIDGGNSFAVFVNKGTIAEVSAVPAPAAAWLFATGLPVVGAFVRRRKQQA